MARATRTLNPLHFEDLEPHRFEDLIRQLAYEYRDWASIEATGKGGADDGIDIRAFERHTAPLPEEDEDNVTVPSPQGRLWIFQCKREKRITPKQVERYVAESLKGELPHGLILAAACDFSKKSYDAFRQALVGTPVQEFQLWGRGELEDLLFQPRNDHLLFAYFGISLQVKKRNLQTETRARIAWRRKVLKALGATRGEIEKDVVIVDAENKMYPFASQVAEFSENPRWGIFRVKYLHPHDFLILEHHRQLAYFNRDTEEWDVLESSSEWVTHLELFDMPSEQKIDPLAWPRRQAYQALVPEVHRANSLTVSKLLLEDILAIEEEGDMVHDTPILYVRAHSPRHLLDPERRSYLEVWRAFGGSEEYKVTPDKRISIFKDFAEPQPALP